MIHFETELFAVDISSGKVKKFSGPTIYSTDVASAQRWCIENGYSYLEVVGPAPIMIVTGPTPQS